MLKFRSLIGFPLVRIQHSPLLGGVTEWFKVTGLNPVEWLITLRGFESYRLLYKLNIRVYGVMVTSHLAMVEFRVRFPVDAYPRDRPSNPMDNAMISKIKT